MEDKIRYESITDESYDGKDFKALNTYEQALTPNQQVSVSERLELAKKLQSLGNTGLDKRIYKNGE